MEPDAGVSEAAASRPALDELLAAATAGDIDVVLVAELDHLGDSLLHLCVGCRAEWCRRGTQITCDISND